MSVLPKPQFMDETTLDLKEQDGHSVQIASCPVHTDTTLEYFCFTCNKSACKQCKPDSCFHNNHIVSNLSNENKLREKLELCITTINNLEMEIIKKVQEKSKELISELEEIHNGKKKDDGSQVLDIDSNLAKVYDESASGKNVTDSETKGAANDTFTKGEPFELSSLEESDASILVAATPMLATQGDCQMEITTGAHSPVNITVKTLVYEEHEEQQNVTDVKLNEGYITLSLFCLSPNLKPEESSISLTISNNGTIPCGHGACALCEHINSSSSITGPNQKIFVIRGRFSCNSTNVIYAMTCSRCPDAVYIGQTVLTLKKRISGHKRDIANKATGVGKHFSEKGHYFRVAVLKECSSKEERNAVEKEIIKELDCVNKGLNKKY